LGNDPPTKENNPQIPVEQERGRERGKEPAHALSSPSIGSERKEDARQTREKILKENS
jgi:hypothetical protein